MTRVSLIVGLLGALLCGCASAPMRTSVVTAEAATPNALDASPYGLFLAGQSAVNHGESGVAAGLFSQAAGEDPGDPNFLGLRAFTAALLAGDISRAVRAAPVGESSQPGLRHLGALVRAVDALARGDGKQSHAILSGADGSLSGEPGAALIGPFASAAAGDVASSIALPEVGGDAVSQFFASLDQGLLLEHAGRFAEAESAYRTLIGKGDPGGLATLALGGMLERRGRASEAASLYDVALAREGATPPLKQARSRVEAKGAPPRQPTLRQGAAQALLAPATVLIAQKQSEIALAYLRLSLRLDPDQGEAWIMVGDVLAASGDAEGARAAYAKPAPNAPSYAAAREKLAWADQNAGDKVEALRIAREIHAADPKSPEAIITLADLLRNNEQYADSAALLSQVIDAKTDKADWRLLYMRAVDYQAMDRWPEAERDLQTAIRLKPEEPELLNFLGFSWIDRGERIPQALAMVQKAVDLDPSSGAMLDSLGWGYFRLGSFSTAVEKLEGAVTLEPADPDINDHLGDAYWRVGRRTEAQFQWRRVLALDPAPKLKSAVEAKLKDGLPERPPIKVAGS